MAQCHEIEPYPMARTPQSNGEIIFPAAGMVVMAMDAVKQLNNNIASPPEIQIKDVTFTHPIRFPQGTDKVETQLNLSTGLGTEFATSWSYFRLFVIDNGSYLECCTGYIQGVTNRQQPNGDMSYPTLDGKPVSDWKISIADVCQGSEQDPYSMSTGSRVQYGLTFQNLENMRLSGQGEAVAYLKTQQWKEGMVETFTQHYAVHPSVLDALAQLIPPALAERNGRMPTMLPTRVSTIWIDCVGMEALWEDKFFVAARCRSRDYRGASASILATSGSQNRPLLCLEGLKTTFISSTEDLDTNEALPRKLCTRIIQKPDIDMMSHEQIFLECTRDRPIEALDEVSKFRSLMLIIMGFIQEALDFVEGHPFLSLEKHLMNYLDWMTYQKHRLTIGGFPVTLSAVQDLLKDPTARMQLANQVEKFWKRRISLRAYRSKPNQYTSP